MRKRKLVISLILGTVALGVLAIPVATIAWYASSDRLLVNTIDLDLRTDKSVDLYISTSRDEDSFSNEIKKNQLNNVEEFIPCSSMRQSEWMDQKSDTPRFYEVTSEISNIGLETNVGFFQQKFYLMSNINYYATLSGVESLFSADKTANSLRAQALADEISELTVDEIEEKLNNLINCLRVSILVTDPENYHYYIIDPTKTADSEPTYYAGRLDTSGLGYYDTHMEGAQEKETIYGEVENRSEIKYNAPVSDTFTPDPNYDPFKKHFFGNGFQAKSKENAYTFNKEESLAAGVSFKQEQSLSLEDLERDDTPLLIPCYNGVATEIVISIYLEGWDLDCYNSTMGASFNAQLSFKLLRGII